MVEMTHDKREHDDAAFVDAYERRLAGGRSEDVPAAWREEIEQMVVIHERLAALPLPEVSSAVRSAVLTAAAHAAAERPQSLWSKVTEFLLRPGPILATAAALALLVAVGQRQTKAPVDAGALAVAESPAAPEIAQAAPETVQKQAVAEPVGAVAQAAAPTPAPPAVAAPAPEPQVVPEQAPALAKADGARPSRMIAAQPASIAPEAQRGEQNVAQAPLQAAQAEAMADDQRKLPPSPVMGMARAAENRAQNLDVLNKNNQFAQAPRAEPKQQVEQEVAAADKKAAESSKDASVVQSEVQQLRAAVDKTTDPAKRKTLLMKLRAAALQAGDGKTAQWAEQALAANAQNDSSAGGVPNKAKAAPAKSEAPASEKAAY